MKKKTLIAGVSVIILLVMTVVLYYLPRSKANTYDQIAFVMGTVFDITLEGKDDPTPKLISLGNDLENDMLSRRIEGSEIAKINASAGDENGYLLSEEMESLLTTCFDISKKSDGAFDITLGALIELWDIDGWASGDRGDVTDFVPPSEEEIAKALELCGYQKVRIEDHRIYLPEGMILDLGAVGKGLYLDKCKAVLDEDVRGTISAGGSILTVGEKVNDKVWRVGIKDPFGDDLYAKALVKPYSCVSTSGNYERFVDYEGVRYHHILDSKTGYPAGISMQIDGNTLSPADTESHTFASVTIVSDSGLISDALSTACYVLGEDRARAFAEECGADILIIYNDGTIEKSSDIFK